MLCESLHWTHLHQPFPGAPWYSLSFHTVHRVGKGNLVYPLLEVIKVFCSLKVTYMHQVVIFGVPLHHSVFIKLHANTAETNSIQGSI